MDDYTHTSMETKLVHRNLQAKLTPGKGKFTMLNTRRQGKSLMAETWRMIQFKMQTCEKMREQLLVDYCILYERFQPAEAIRDKILNEEDRFVRVLDGTEKEFLTKQYTLLKEMKRNRL